MAKKVGHPASSGGHTGRRRSMSRAKIYLVATVLIIVFLPSFVKYQELRYKNKRLEDEISLLNTKNKRLTEEKKRLETDITYVEQRARENMGMARKGEIILRQAPR
jgi:cell division protein FtsB